MKNKTKLLIVMLFAFSFFMGFSAKTFAEAKIALVDMSQIVKNYDKAREAQAELQINQKKIKKMITEAREEISKIKGEEEKKEREKKLAEKILEKNKTFREKFSKEWQQVQNKILLTIKNVADNGKYDLVVDKHTVIAGGEDITGKVLAELDK